MKHIVIVGGGFAGTLTAVHLIRQAGALCNITLIDQSGGFNKGFAYNPYTTRHLLNVAAAKMSAFADQPDHFLNWVMQQPAFLNKEKHLVAHAFLPRSLYGLYLSDIWHETQKMAAQRHLKLSVIFDKANDLDVKDKGIVLTLSDGITIRADYCVLATGNQLPRNPAIPNTSFYNSAQYFRNPWSADSVKDVDPHKPVCIIGNGLTMVDTVFGLKEFGFKGEIYAISPNGFNILPHRHPGLPYTRLAEELKESMNLYQLVKRVHHHIRELRTLGISAEPVIDSLRPHTQKIWQAFSPQEKRQFMSRFRHLWGVARHRIPLPSHDNIQQMRIDGKLHIRSGFIRDITLSGEEVCVRYFDRKNQMEEEVRVSRVINCTGPESDIGKMEKGLLTQCLDKGLITQDELKLGIRTDIATYRIMNALCKPQRHLYTLGSNLRGELWESTAVNELRMQAAQLAKILTEENEV